MLLYSLEYSVSAVKEEHDHHKLIYEPEYLRVDGIKGVAHREILGHVRKDDDNGEKALYRRRALTGKVVVQQLSSVSKFHPDAGDDD